MNRTIALALVAASASIALAQTPDVAPSAPEVGPTATAKLFRLVTTMRWADTTGGPAHIRVVGRGVGPIVEFYTPLV